MKEVYIALPVAKSENINVRLMNFLLQSGDKYRVIIGCEIGHHIADNRNKLVAKFLKSECEWIFFVDTDTIPPINALDMIKHKLDICSGYYYQWHNKGLVPLILKKVEGGYTSDVGRPTKIKNVVEVDAAGAGCLLINRNVFETIEKPYFLNPHNDEGFVTSSEDIYFFKKAIKVGYKVYVDRSVVASHIKTVDLFEVAQWNYRIIQELKNK